MGRCRLSSTSGFLRLFAIVVFLLFEISFFVSAYEWNSSLNEGIKVYYDFNSSTNLVDGRFNLTSFEGNAIFNDSECLIGLCGQTLFNNNMKIASNPVTMYSGAYSINFWVRGIYTDTSTSRYFLSTYPQSSHNFGWDQPGTTYVYRQNGWTGNYGNLPGATGFNTWFMMTVTRDNSNGVVKIYRDGSQLDAGNAGSAFPGGDILLGNAFNGIFDWHGQFDELGYWNRTLSQSEIVQLFNDGLGLTYDSNMTAPPRVSPFQNICWLNQTNNFTSDQVFRADVAIIGLLTGGKNIFAAYDGLPSESYKYSLDAPYSAVRFDSIDRQDSLYDYSSDEDYAISLLAEGHYTIRYNGCIFLGGISDSDEDRLLFGALFRNDLEVPGTRTYFQGPSNGKRIMCGSINKDLYAEADDKISIKLVPIEGSWSNSKIYNVGDASAIHIEWSS